MTVTTTLDHFIFYIYNSHVGVCVIDYYGCQKTCGNEKKDVKNENEAVAAYY